MRILYGIQCTGNGHITRSIDLINELRKYVRVDVLTSGAHSEITLPFEVKYKKRGLAYYFGKNGSFDLTRTFRENNLLRFRRELDEVPTHMYDMVISDFEPITAWSAKRNWVYSVAVSNQAGLQHPSVPKPNIVSPFSKLLINNFCPTTRRYGLSYKKLGEGLYYPPIRKSIKSLNPTSGDYYVVYLPFYDHKKIAKHLNRFANEKWVVFSKHIKEMQTIGNVQVMPINEESFLSSIEKCRGVLCSAGFGTTSEALFLRKKLIVIPMKNQYEQQCNAFLLNSMGVPNIKSLKKKHYDKLADWLQEDSVPTVDLKDETEFLVKKMLEDYVLYVSEQWIESA